MDPDSDKTRIIRSNKATPQPPAPSDQDDADATRILKPTGHAARPLSDQVNDPDETRILPRAGGATPVTDIPLVGGLGDSPPAGGNDATRIIDSSKTKLVRRSSVQNQSVEAGPSGGPGSSMADPVVGWLVVIDGPGQGSMICIGEQDNRVGRGGGHDAPRVCLGFGDAGISRSNAFVIRYDPKKRRFKILPGEGANIVYLNDEDLDSPTALKPGDIIEVSETKLRFAPFCGNDFDWADVEAESSE
ncbi:MAG: FHA domain-containing protein [Akkermansiaceae bacterium]|nr:FHA domain-containing protein [Akkermansiaceae bacterium]